MDAVLFDLDDTLCAYRRPGREVLALAFETVGAEPCFTIEDYYGIYEEYAGTADTVDRQREACFEALAADAGAAPEDGRAVARAYAADRDHRNVALLDGARDALDSLARDHELGLVTNGAPAMQAQKLDALDLRTTFETIVHGGHDSLAKPAPEPFLTALDDLDVTPDRAIHVGNALEADIAGAQAAGLRAVWLENDESAPGETVPEYTVASLAELVEPPWLVE